MTTPPAEPASAAQADDGVARTPEGRVASPCINVCQMHEPTALCRGCARTIAEITAWRNADDGQRLRVLAAMPARRALLQAHGALVESAADR
ncbi:DUF1289 domain-containing protein [Roseateles amylovorans]|uniref:DUF1289 domain-containing protein n=1 Tax=Roseateles amylovorans TaxID=2978473 RepID=A0ABY6B6A6_9BURK|nr:DUF1289 domain-containing protein [Roseateles amylovorans]UXH80449.1 DUF1289 domain-containing protein [Roseateles amylovorans]